MFYSNRKVRKRRGSDHLLKFTTTDIFLLPNHPRKVTQSTYELQYTVFFPHINNQSSSKLLKIHTVKDAFEDYRTFISRRLGVSLGHSTIIPFDAKITEQQPKTTEQQSAKNITRTTSNRFGTTEIVGIAIGTTAAVVVVALIVYKIW